MNEFNRIKIYISYLEIYNETLIDLLNPKGDPSQLKIKVDPNVGKQVMKDGDRCKWTEIVESQES